MFKRLKETVEGLRHLLKPEEYADDWYQWVTNQGAHASIVGIALFLIIVPFANSMLHTWVVATVFYWLFWEYLIQRDTTKDSIVDVANVSIGAGFMSILFHYIPSDKFFEAYYYLLGVFIAWLVFLFIGVIRRI